jgi:hypothetical protein
MHLEVFVDNFFGYVHKSKLALVSRVLDAFFVKANIQLHERVSGPVFPGLGWEWDLQRQVMTCPKLKMDILRRYLDTWHSQRESIGLLVLEMACGLVMWFSAGIPAFRPYVAPLTKMRYAGKAKYLRKACEKRSVNCHFTPEARHALDVITAAFRLWSGECPMVQGFGPTARWQMLGRVDACTDWGCGGIAYDGVSLRGFMHKWDGHERELAKCKVRESSGVFEVLGCVYWLQLFATSCARMRLQLEMDSNPGVSAMNRAFSETAAMLTCVSEARKLCAESHICARWRFIRGDVYNITADHLSHGRWDEAVVSARLEFGVELIRVSESSTPVFVCPTVAQGVAESVQR